MSLHLLEAVVFVVALAATILGGPRRFMRGRHISKAVTRRVGHRRALTLRNVLIWGGVALSLGYPVAYCVLTGAVAVWALDDLLFPDDDDRKKRRYEWARVRLRMPKPVKLRPIEWAGAPA